MLLHKSKWHFIQLILVIEQQLSYSIFLCTPGMRSLWPMRKEGGKKKQKASLLHCSLLFSFSGKVPLHSISKYCCQYCNCRIQHFSKNVTEKGKIQTAYERTAACRWSKSYTQGSHKQFWVPLLYFYARDCSHIRNSNRWKLGQLQGEEENASGKSTLAHSSRPQLRQGEFQGDGVVTG